MLWTRFNGSAESAAAAAQTRSSQEGSHARAPSQYQDKTNKTFIRLSIFFRLSEVGSQWRQAEQGVLGLLLNSNAFWHLLGNPMVLSWDI